MPSKDVAITAKLESSVTYFGLFHDEVDETTWHDDGFDDLFAIEELENPIMVSSGGFQLLLVAIGRHDDFAS